MAINKNFDIRPGIYSIPDYGRVVATKSLEDGVSVKLYLSDTFPFISLKEGGVDLLKKEKLSEKEIARLILKSKSSNEVDLILKVKSNKVLENIAETKKQSFLIIK